MTKSEDNYTAVLLEEIRSQMQAVLEIAIDTRKKVSVLPTMQEDIAELKEDVKTIKHAVKETNQDLRLLKRRVTRLEQKAA